LEDVGVDGSIIFEWILGTQGETEWTGFTSFGIGFSDGLL